MVAVLSIFGVGPAFTVGTLRGSVFPGEIHCGSVVLAAGQMACAPKHGLGRVSIFVIWAIRVQIGNDGAILTKYGVAVVAGPLQQAGS